MRLVASLRWSVGPVPVAGRVSKHVARDFVSVPPDDFAGALDQVLVGSQRGEDDAHPPAPTWAWSQDEGHGVETVLARGWLTADDDEHRSYWAELSLDVDCELSTFLEIWGAFVTAGLGVWVVADDDLVGPDAFEATARESGWLRMANLDIN